MGYLKEKLKFIFSRIFSLALLDRLKQNIIWRNILRENQVQFIAETKKKLEHNEFNKKIRNIVWDEIAKYLGKNSKIMYIELGVWEGYSINYFSKLFINTSSEFNGFDTFTGMPEQWRHMDVGHYNQSENLPRFSDNRVKLHKGIFQNTLENFLKNIKVDKDTKILINFDCVLYTSTLFCLTKIENYFKDYYFVFDEFYGDECRAFKHFVDSYKKDYELIVASKSNYAPEVVFGKFK